MYQHPNPSIAASSLGRIYHPPARLDGHSTDSPNPARNSLGRCRGELQLIAMVTSEAASGDSTAELSTRLNLEIALFVALVSGWGLYRI